VCVRSGWTGTFLALILMACGGGSLSLSEYAAQAENLVAVMEAEFESLDTEWESQAPTLEGARSYWEGRLEVRADFLEGVRDLDPPDTVAEQHAEALDVFGRITDADEALAARVATLETITDHWQWVDTPEGRAAQAVLEEVFAFCRASQAEFDSTEDREALADVPWLPSEMSEVVSVAFGCPSP
jgi:hypothetical protein